MSVRYATRIQPCLDVVEHYAASGLTDMDIADRFCVPEKTFRRWCKEHEELRDAIRRGRRRCVLAVENAVYGMAIGDPQYKQVEIKKKRTKVGVDENGDPIYALVTDQKVYKHGPNLNAARYYLEQRDSANWNRNPINEADEEVLDKAREILEGVDSNI